MRASLGTTGFRASALVFLGLVLFGPLAAMPVPAAASTTSYATLAPSHLAAAVGGAVSDLAAGQVHASTDINSDATVRAGNQLCIDDVCVTKDDLRAFLESRAASSSTPGQGSPAATSTASSTPADIEPPTLTIQGNNPATVTVGDEYADLGAIAHDNSGIATVRTYQGGSEVTTPRINTSAPGSYVIEYRASDPSGNLATSSRTVIVRAANDDTTAATTTSAVVGE